MLLLQRPRTKEKCDFALPSDVPPISLPVVREDRSAAPVFCYKQTGGHRGRPPCSARQRRCCTIGHLRPTAARIASAMTSFWSASAPSGYARRCSASTTDGSTMGRRGTAPARTVGSSQCGSTPDGRGCRLTFPSRATGCRAKQPRELRDRCRRDPTTRPRPPRLAPFRISGESGRTIASLAQRRFIARLLLRATRSRRRRKRDARKATPSIAHGRLAARSHFVRAIVRVVLVLVIAMATERNSRSRSVLAHRWLARRVSGVGCDPATYPRWPGGARPGEWRCRGRCWSGAAPGSMEMQATSA